MNQHERWHRLLEMVADAGQLDIESTARELGVSAATVRRDFDELAGQQLVTRTRGGVIATSVSYDLPLRYKVARQAPEKQRIAAAAAAMIPAGVTVGLNGGTTTTEVARVLALRTDPDGSPTPVTVVTNALNIANELIVRPHIRVVMTGGTARTQSYELVGRIAETMLTSVALDLVVLGVDAVDHQHGASAHNDDEAAINHVMVTSAARTLVVADSSKIGRRTFNRICLPGSIDTLITDKAADQDQVRLIEQAGVTVVQV
ncbi:DeoR/GlpR family DNA-binding transcription regulator [Actinoplanes sp. DH11]|uniref:DeoR/GlpR family DNA-binding transcription regulator n=1 Tax=Actinoplanes sp. DH11 TaxID=2857011 RepID=UPI001E325233|nr:DeoR/GlpR family DNA-binding transcription regulator [Actinoplanes sp. DH11]